MEIIELSSTKDSADKKTIRGSSPANSIRNSNLNPTKLIPFLEILSKIHLNVDFCYKISPQQHNFKCDKLAFDYAIIILYFDFFVFTFNFILPG